MKNIILSIALGACVLAPAFAGSAPASQTYSFAANSDTDTISFVLGGKNSTPGTSWDVKAEASWVDMLVNHASFNGALSWALSGAASRSGALSDGAGKEGESFINLSGLSAGKYKLTFTGDWGAESITAPKGSKFEYAEGRVELGDDVHISSHVPAVPEPETYALMFAGLAMIGTVAQRRKERESAV
jgi:hypothetical protein